MLFGSSTLYRMVVKSDGSPNWTGIWILIITFGILYIWRCCVIIPEYWVAVRKRFGRVVRDKNGNPVEYDPLGPLEGEGENDANKKSRSLKQRLYMVNSLELVNCGDRETPLGIDKITFCEVDFDTDFTAAWAISRQPGCPTKSIQIPGTDNRKKRDKDQLEDLVRGKVKNAVIRAFEAREATHVGELKNLPTLSVEQDSELAEVASYLLEKYGVDFQELWNGQRAVAGQSRDLQGRREIAESNKVVARAHDNVADAIRGYPLGPIPKEAGGSLYEFRASKDA